MAEKQRDERVLPLWEHVNELANLLRAWIYAFVISTIAFLAFPVDLSFLQNPLAFYKPLISVVLLTVRDRLLPPDVILIPGPLTGPIEVYVISSVVFGFAISLPLLAYKIYRFIDPALKPEERKAVYPFVTAFSLLFLGGSLFGFFLLLPWVVAGTLLFFPVTGAKPFVNIEDFYTLVFITTLMTGFVFTLPVVLVLLVKFGIVGTGSLTKNRKYLWVAVFILTAIITPDGGPIADFVLFVPFIILLEGSILVARRYEKRRGPKQEKKEPEPLTCKFCGGPVDPGGVFCGRCGKSRL